MTEKNQRILIIRLSAIGDVLRVLPALQVLKKSYPHSYIAWAVEEQARDILEAHPDIDEVLIFPKKSIVSKLKTPGRFNQGVKEFFTFIREVRQKRFDIVYDFHGLFKSGIIGYLSGAPDRFGFTRAFTKECNFLLNNRRFPLEHKRISRVERNLALLHKSGFDIAHAPPVIHIPAGDQALMQDFFRQAQIAGYSHPGRRPGPDAGLFQAGPDRYPPPHNRHTSRHQPHNTLQALGALPLCGCGRQSH